MTSRLTCGRVSALGLAVAAGNSQTLGSSGLHKTGKGGDPHQLGSVVRRGARRSPGRACGRVGGEKCRGSERTVSARWWEPGGGVSPPTLPRFARRSTQLGKKSSESLNSCAVSGRFVGKVLKNKAGMSNVLWSKLFVLHFLLL